jgi:hypothetical protein
MYPVFLTVRSSGAEWEFIFEREKFMAYINELKQAGRPA